MPDMHLRNVDASLLRAVNVAATKSDLTQRDWVIKVLAEAANGHAKEKRNSGGVQEEAKRGSVRGSDTDLPQLGESRDLWHHNPKTCRLYGCLMCAEVRKPNGKV